MERKDFLKKLTLGSGMLAAPFLKTSARAKNLSRLKPQRIKQGDVAAIISPAGRVVESDDIEQAVQAVKKLGLKPKLGENLGTDWGYLGGRDTQRLNDLHNAFSDPEVKVIFPIRGGFGTSRLLPMLDFDLIRNNPKAFVGFSDNTSLILSMNQFAGLVTFYGPNALFDWTDYTSDNWRKVLMSTKPVDSFPYLSEKKLKRKSIVEGKAKGELLGGNLSLLIQTLGTRWEIDTRDKILFFEDVNESPYEVDRMLTHLWLARKLQVARGFAIGHFTNTGSNGEIDVMEVIRDRFEPLGKPCYVGISTGHVSNILTLPVGINVELDATTGKMSTAEGAVV